MPKKFMHIDLLIIAVFILITGLFILLQLRRSSEDRFLASSSIIDGRLEDLGPGFDPADTTKRTYPEFKAIEMEQEGLRTWKEYRNSGMGHSFEWNFIGFRMIEECDTCTTMLTVSRQYKGPAKYYLVLPGYTLTDPENYFYVDSGRNYLGYVVWDKEQTVTDGNRYGHYASKELPFRFSYNSIAHPVEKNKGAVLIPINKKTYNLLRVSCQALLIIGGLVLLYICFAIPAKILIRISAGEIFTKHHAHQLNRVAWLLLGLPFAVILLQCILRLVFNQTITGDVSLAVLTTLGTFKGTLIAGIIFLAIAKAFKRGLRLQKEQDLTI